LGGKKVADCIFCRIIAGEIPSQMVYQDELVVAFRDIHPVAPVHLLIVPRKHVNRLTETTEADREWLARIQEVAAELARREGVAESGFRLVANFGPDGGQEVPHVHYHLVGGRPLGGIG
jgi:histidine triad (HIT) family protein